MRVSSFTTLLLLSGAYALPTLTLPWFGQVGLDRLIGCLGYFQLDEDRTVYQVLKDDENFSRLVKAIDLSDRVVDLLDDPSQSITFFAVPNSGLPKHGKRRGGDPEEKDLDADTCHNHNDLGHLVLQAEQLDLFPESDDKEKRKKCLARIVRGILAYHILPEKYTSTELLENSTYATNLTLKDGSLDYQPLRISVKSTTIPPRLKINAYAEVTIRDTEAKNGIIHHIKKPLFPPPSIFQEIFLFPGPFSYVTSALQRVGLTSDLDRRHFRGEDGHHGSFQGATATTFFAPISLAFQRLPKKLQFFLFSPFGERALRKLLEYHIVPDFVFFTDYAHNATSEDSDIIRFVNDVKEAQLHAGHPGLAAYFDDVTPDMQFSQRPIPLPNPIYEYNITLPTLLTNHTLDVSVARYKSKLPIPGKSPFFTRFKVNGRDVGLSDIPARNGALHIITSLLYPRKHHHHHRHGHGHKHRGDEEIVDEIWNDWEEWLPQWAAEN